MLIRRQLARSTFCAALALSISLPALAQQPAENAPQPTATELREKGKAALAQGDIAGACSFFERSYQAASKPGAEGPPPDDVLFDLADCHEKQSKSAIAAAEFEQIATGTSGRAEEAKKRAAALRSPRPNDPAPAGTGTGDKGPPTGTPPVATTTAAPPPAPPPEPKATGNTRLGDFMDTRLTWTGGDDDVLHSTGQTVPVSPNFSIGDRKQYRLFFDNLNSRFAGRENLTHVVLYKKLPSFFSKLDTEASVVLRFDLAELSKGSSAQLSRAIYDSGSYLRLFYHTDGTTDGKVGLGLTLFPLDTDRMRLGYLYDITWGGTAQSINQSVFPRLVGSAPGFKLQYDGAGWYLYGGFKAGQIVQVEQTLKPGTSEVEELRIQQTNIGVMGGLGFDLGSYVHFDAGGGYFQQGKFDFEDVRDLPVFTVGESARLVIHDKDSPPVQSVDFLLYRNDPNKPMVLFKPEQYSPGKTTWTLSVEQAALFQNLKDFERTGVTRLQPALAFAAQANLKAGYLRASLTGLYRDLPFVVRNQPSLIPFVTLPVDAATQNELFIAASLDYFIAAAHLTPGFGAGLQFPAQIKTSSLDTNTTPIERTVVVREQGDQSILPVNRSGVPVFKARVSLKWDLSSIVSAIGWVQYSRDNNGTVIDRDPGEGTAIRVFTAPDFLGFGASVQARF